MLKVPGGEPRGEAGLPRARGSVLGLREGTGDPPGQDPSCTPSPGAALATRLA